MLTKLCSLRSHQGFKRYFFNTSWMFVEQVLRLISGLLVGIWVARHLGPTQFGILSYVLAFTAILGGIAKLGLDNIIVRDLIVDSENRNKYLGTAFWLKICGAIIAFILITIATLFTSNDSTTNLYIYIIAGGMIFQSFEVIDFYFQSQILSKFVSISKITQLLISSCLKIYFVLKSADLFWFVLITLFDQITLAISLVIAFKIQRIGSFYKIFDTTIAVKLIKDSWPLILSALMAMIYMRIDQIMIKEMLGTQQLGIYSAAVRISEVWYFLPVIITNSLFPAILSARQLSEDLYITRLQRLYAFMIWLAICIAVPMTFMSNWIIISLYGSAYEAAGRVLMINVWSGIFVFLSAVFGKYLISENLTRINFYRTVVGAVLNVILSYYLIIGFGINGAAFATLISLVIVNIGYDIFDKRLRFQLILKLSAFAYPFWRR